MRKIMAISIVFCVFLLSTVPISLAKTDDSSIILLVDSMYALKEACEGKQNASIKLVADIMVTEDLVLSGESQKKDIVLDLDGHSLAFENEKSLFVEQTICLTLTSAQNGASVVFLYNPEAGFPGHISSSGSLILDGDIQFTAKNVVTGSNLTPIGRSIGHNLIYIESDLEKSTSLFVMKAGTLNALGNYRAAVECDWGQVIINGGFIHIGSDDNATGYRSGIGITNYGGKIIISGGEIHATGDDCIAVRNSDTFNPSGTLAMMGEYIPSPVRDTFVITSGVVHAKGKNAVAVAVERNCSVLGGTISASGEKSVGISYYYVNRKNNETPNVTLLGGKVVGEGSAIIDNRDYDAWYKNIAGEAMAVDSSTKEITPGYKDVANGSWYAFDFYTLVYEGILKGYPNGEFNPHGNITRAEFITLLARYSKEDLSQYEDDKPPFTDVEASKWYTAPIAWGEVAGIAKGYTNASFGINDTITREQVVSMLYRYTEYTGTNPAVKETESLRGFSDVTNISDWAIPAMQWAVDVGLVQGIDNNKIAPKELASRAEIAVLFMRLSK